MTESKIEYDEELRCWVWYLNGKPTIKSDDVDYLRVLARQAEYSINEAKGMAYDDWKAHNPDNAELGPDPQALHDEELLVAYRSGYIAALHDYAWWKDGTQYVGCGNLTLQDAVRRAARKTGGEADGR